MNSCWCGSKESEVWFEGIYESPEVLLNCIIERCSCGMIFTKKCSVIQQRETTPENASIEEVKRSKRHQNSKSSFDLCSIPGNILEVGCGSGAFLQYIGESDKFTSCVGIDKNKCWKGSKDGKFEYKQATIQEEFGVYDNIVIVHCLEHVENIAEFLSSLNKNTKEGTRIYFCVPNSDSYKNYTRFRGESKYCNFGAFAPDEHCWHFTIFSLLSVIATFLKGAIVVHCGISSIWGNGEQIEIVVEM